MEIVPSESSEAFQRTRRASSALGTPWEKQTTFKRNLTLPFSGIPYTKLNEAPVPPDPLFDPEPSSDFPSA